MWRLMQGDAPPLCLGCWPRFEHKGRLRRWGSGLLHRQTRCGQSRAGQHQQCVAQAWLVLECLAALEGALKLWLQLPTTGYITAAVSSSPVVLSRILAE